MKRLWYKNVFALFLSILLVLQNFSFVYAEEKSNNDHQLVKQYKEVVNSYRNAGLSDLNTNEDENGIVSVVLLIHDDEEIKEIDANESLEQTDKLLQIKKLRKAQHEKLIVEFNQLLEKEINITDETTVLSNAIALYISLKDLNVLANHPSIELIQSNDKFMPKPTGLEKKKETNSSFFRSARSMYRGEGQIIAVIDSGFDVNHVDMRITDLEQVSLSESLANEKITNFELKGKYFNSKFPYGYNYADNTQELMETAAFSHGTHVAGIAAGSGEFGSRSSEAQVLALRVFSDRFKGTEPMLYAKAIEDAIILKAGTINMSLGASSAVAKDINPLVERTMENARKIGTVINVSAGNDGFSNHSVGNPKAENPNYATVGTPSIAKASISVASINGLNRMLPSLKDGANNVYEYQPSSAVALTEIYNKQYQVVDLKRAKPEDIATLTREQVEGKVALIERGEITFAQKIEEATKLGAVAAIIYNNPENEGKTFSMGGLDATTIPSLVVKRNHGLALLADGHVTISKDIQAFTYDDAGNLSDFSSWGTAPEYDLKPEITGVGGNVYAAQPNNSYANESGTSMAAPNVSAATALLQQRLKDDDSIVLPVAADAQDLTVLSIFTKNLLMSTAVPHAQNGDPYASPRKQGAGVANIDALLQTKAYVTAQATADDPYPLAKVNLNTVGNEISFTVTVHNISKTETLTFKPVATLTTDKLDPNEPKFIIPVGSRRIVPDLELDAITLGPNSSQDVTIHFNYESEVARLEQDFVNGFHVEGFVRFVSENPEQQPSIGLPFIGFHGPVDQGTRSRYVDLPVVEKAIYDYANLNGDAPLYYHMDDSKTASPFTTLLSGSGPNLVVLGEKEATNDRVFSREKLAISPNGDEEYDFVAFRGVFINHFTRAGIKIYNQEGDLVYQGTELYNGTSGLEIGRRADVVSGDPESYSTRFQQHEEWLWDGQKQGAVANENKRFNQEDIVEDGKYRFEFHAQGIMDDSKVQYLNFDVYVDTKKPEISETSYQEDTKQFQVTLTDTGSGLDSIVLVKKDLEGNVVDVVAVTITEVDEHTKTATFSLAENEDAKDWSIQIKDFAANKTEKSLVAIQHENELAELSVKFVDYQTNEEIQLDPSAYTLVVKDLENRTVTQLNELLFGDYSLQFKVNTLDYLAIDTNQTVTLSAENRQVTVTFRIKPQTAFEVTFTPILYPEIDADASTVYLLATNKETGQTTKLPIDILNILSTPTFDGKLTVGNWTLEVKGLPEDWTATPMVFETTVSEQGKVSNKPNIILIKGETMSITPVVKIVGGDIQSSDLSFEAYTGTIFFDDLTKLPLEEKYVVKPKETPEGYVFNPDYVVLIRADEKHLEAHFTLTKLTDKTRGKVTVRTVMNPSDETAIAVDYYATDINGNVNFNINDLPYGTWYIKPLHYNKAYESDQVLQQVVISADNTNPTVEFVWSKLSLNPEKFPLNISVIHSPRSTGSKYKRATNGIYEFEIVNMDTNEVTLASGTMNEFNRLTTELLPRGYYKITPKVAEGYIAVPTHRYVRLEGADTENVLFGYYRQMPLDLSPIHKVDSDTKAEVIIPTFAPVNQDAFKFVVEKLDQRTVQHNGQNFITQVYEMKIINLGIPNAETVLHYGMEDFMHEKWTVKLPLEDFGDDVKVVYLSTGGLGIVDVPYQIEEVDGVKYVVFEVDHFSQYGIAKPAPTPPTPVVSPVVTSVNESPSTLPKTGYTSLVPLALGCLLSSVYLFKKKDEE